MNENARIIAIFTICFACGAVGYGIADARGDRNIAELRQQYAEKVAMAESHLREREVFYNERINKAVDELMAAESSRDSLRGDIDRLRESNAALRRRLSGTDETACKSYREALSECTGLLQRGTELLARGTEVARKNAAEHDALTAWIK